jgi:hypothetical protein
MAQQHVVVSGHYYASLAGLQILEAGGNAIDAGVATGLAIDVLESEFVGFGGVAPAMIHLAERDERHVISGVGVWPRSADLEFFHRHHGGRIPEGLLHSVVPAAPSIWITALARFGTMSFGEFRARRVPDLSVLRRAGRGAAGQLQALAQHRGDLPAQWHASSRGRHLRAERSRSHAAIHGRPGAGTRGR